MQNTYSGVSKVDMSEDIEPVLSKVDVVLTFAIEVSYCFLKACPHWQLCCHFRQQIVAENICCQCGQALITTMFTSCCSKALRCVDIAAEQICGAAVKAIVNRGIIAR